MSWAKLDDGFWMHPKTIMAGNTAAGVFARMLSYSGCYLTDGLVPADVANTIAGSDKKAIEKLAEVGLVQVLPTGSVFIPDFLEHNRSKAQVEADREQRRAAGRRGGRQGRKGAEA